MNGITTLVLIAIHMCVISALNSSEPETLSDGRGRTCSITGFSFVHCPDGWIRYENKKCFRRFIYPQHTHPDAQRICKSANGNLASINSKDEHEFIKSYIIRDVPTSQLTHTWIGGLRKYSNVWNWLDLKPFNYTDWLPGYPKVGNLTSSESCLALSTTQKELKSPGLVEFGKMTNSLKCTEKGNYICQKFQMDTRKVIYAEA